MSVLGTAGEAAYTVRFRLIISGSDPETIADHLFDAVLPTARDVDLAGPGPLRDFMLWLTLDAPSPEDALIAGSERVKAAAGAESDWEGRTQWPTFIVPLSIEVGPAAVEDVHAAG